MAKIRYQCFHQGILYASYKNRVLYKPQDEIEWKTYLIVKDLTKLNNLELYKRLLREGIHNYYKIDSRFDAIVLKGKIQFYKDKKLINTLIVENGSRPLRSGIVYKAGYIIYSEYHGNVARNPVKVYKYDYVNNVKDTLYTFKDIRHIHFIQEDICDYDSVYIGTGDFDKECGIYKFNIKNKSINKVGGGSQLWRAVSIVQIDGYLYWGTDDPDGQNFIIKYDFTNAKLQKLKYIEGPAYYSAKTKNNVMYIATTIEDRKKHRAIIYKSIDGKRWTEVIEFKKDIFHTKYFGYGVVEFINKQEKINDIYYNLEGLK